MARQEPDPPRELDPLKGGLKHNPFAALRGKVETANGPTKPASKHEPELVTERLSVRIERTGRGGKTVTIADGPAFAGRPLDALAREIARALGTGARVEGATIVVQGDQRERLVAWLGERGFVHIAAGN